MRRLLTLLLFSACLALAGGAGRPPQPAAAAFPGHLYQPGASPVTALPPEVDGALRDEWTQAQAGMLPLLMLVPTTTFATNLPADPMQLLAEAGLPCLPETPLRAAFLANSPAAYAVARRGFERQGYRVLGEVEAADFPGQISFLLAQGDARVLGHWAPGLTGQRSTIALCLVDGSVFTP